MMRTKDGKRIMIVEDEERKTVPPPTDAETDVAMAELEAIFFAMLFGGFAGGAIVITGGVDDPAQYPKCPGCGRHHPTTAR